MINAPLSIDKINGLTVIKLDVSFVDTLYVKDKNGKYWQLTPITNPNIEMPFQIVPMQKEGYEL